MKWFFIFSGLIAWTGKHMSSSCPLEMSPPRVVVGFGDPFSVTCSSLSDQSESLGWESTYGKGIGLQPGVSSVSLEVDSVKDWNLEPLCFLNLLDGEQCMQTLPITVYKTPDSVSMSQPSEMGPMVEGEKYRMQCDIINVAPVRNLSVHWHKGHEIIYTETFGDSSLSAVDTSSVFNLKAQRGDNGTQIWCEAQLDFWPPVPNLPKIQSKSHEVIVLYSPTFTKPENETLELSAGSDIILDCTATGNPMPEYSWHFPQPIQQNQNENQPILTPSNQLPGTYKCTASNTQGTRTKYFTVIEAASSHPGTTAGISMGKHMSSSCPLEMSPPRVVVGFGDPFSVTCSSLSDQSESLGWESTYGKGIGLQPGVSSVSLEVDSVKDWNLEPLCFLNLLDGEQCMQTLPITVYKTPDSVSMSQPSEMGPMVEGEKYRMQCDIINVAPVGNLSVHWHKGHEIIYTETFEDSSLSAVDTSSVFNLKAQRGDNGTQIWCEAQLDFWPPVPNLPTIQSKSHEVIVLYSPTFTKPENETLELSAGSDIILDCTATGNPMPEYSWHFPQPIQQNQNENQPILTPSNQLPGTYKCTASNTQGTRTKYFTVIKAASSHPGTTAGISMGKHMSSSCPLEMSPPRVVVGFGDPFSVTCSSLSDQSESLGWESTYGKGIGLQPGVSSVSLEVDSVKDWNLEPLCFLNLLDGEQCMQTLPITVYKTPDSVSMSQPSEMGPMVEGEKYRMQCDIINVAPVRNLSVHWHKGHEIIYTETFEDSSLSAVDTSSVFNLKAQRGDNGTQIWCEAQLDFWPPVPNLPKIQSKSHEVIVLYSPTFTKPENETLELSAGSDIILDCTATGNPMPEYSWHFPQPIQQNQNENQPILTPSNQLPGTYKCTASNTQGTRTKYFNVIEAASSHPGTTAGILMTVFFVLIFILGWNRTTFGALLGGFLSLGVVLIIAGLLTLTPQGTFSFSNGSYQKGRPTSSEII